MIQGFHAVMNLLLMPMWLLSGALFPYSEASSGLQVVMRFNPISHGLSLLQGAVLQNWSPEIFAPETVSWIVLLTFSGVFIMIAAVSASRRRVQDSV